MPPDGPLRTLLTATILCVVCSVVVSTSAVGLRSFQEENKKRFRQRNILEAAGYSPEDIREQGVATLFENIETRLINLETGDLASGKDADAFDQRAAAKDPTLTDSMAIPEAMQTFGFTQHERFGRVYLLKDGETIQKVILPIYGKGLWSTLYGFISLERDLQTVSGITFYEHKETPGLGGEVDNAQWKAQWSQKRAFDEAGEVRIEIVKGKVVTGGANAAYQIDGLSGATITSKGVSNAVRYWLGHGYGPFLQKLKSENNG